MMPASNSRTLWASQFKLDKFLFKHESVGDFHKFQWSNNVLPYAIYRTALFVYVFAIMIYAPLYYEQREKFLIYATYWSFMFLTVGVFVSAVNAWIYYSKQDQIGKWSYILTVGVFMSAVNAWVYYSKQDQIGKWSQIQDEQEDISWNVKLQWFLVNVYQAKAFVVTLLFWVFIFDGGMTYATFNTHAVNSIIVVVDLAITLAPVRFLHIWQPMSVIFVYAVFTFIYWQAGGTNADGKPYIYKLTDYDNNLVTGLVMVGLTVFVGTPLMHVIVFVLYWARQCAWWYSSKRSGSVHDSSNVTSENPEDIPIA